jgi:predicted metal-dependent hydrolase
MTRTEQQRRRFKLRVHTWAGKLRVEPTAVRVQKMRRKWASCSTRGWVSFSARLLRQPRDFQDYVIVHELLHLKVPNHGKLFKSLLRLHLPSPPQPHSARK